MFAHDGINTTGYEHSLVLVPSRANIKDSELLYLPDLSTYEILKRETFEKKFKGVIRS